jgi:hypothetical protein
VFASFLTPPDIVKDHEGDTFGKGDRGGKFLRKAAAAQAIYQFGVGVKKSDDGA